LGLFTLEEKLSWSSFWDLHGLDKLPKLSKVYPLLTSNGVCAVAHSPLLRYLRRTFYQAHRSNIDSEAQGKTIAAKLTIPWSRRRFIKLAALASGGALATHHLAFPNPVWGNRSPRIAIIGGGIAGLNAAYQLKKSGLNATVYEAQRRVGGRIQSVRGVVGRGLVSDLGGHFINTDHRDMLTLANELGLSLFNRAADAETLPFPDVAYYFGGHRRPESEVANKLRPLASQILADAIALDEDFDTVSRRLDRLSVTQYLNNYSGLISEPFIRVLIENSIRTEYGVEPEDSSALQLIRQFKFEVHQCLIYLNRILQMAFCSQAIFSAYC
jgi:monoamine oxidase